MVVLLGGFVVGCDQINQFFEVKPESKPEPQIVKTTEQAEVAVEPEGTQLARVNGKKITYEEFEQNIKNLQAISEEIAIDGFDARKNLLDEMINQELLYQEAKSRGIHKKKEVKDLADGYLRGLVVRQLVIDTTENVTVDAQEIETFYNQYKDQMSEPEQRRVREIVVSSEDRAREILIALLQEQDFATLAKERSIGDSSKNAGDIGFIMKGQRGEEYKQYDDVAFSLDKGQVSGIFKGPKGYYLIKVDEINESEARLLTDVWDDVKQSLLTLKQQQRVQDLTDRLRGDAKVEISAEMLK